jgi:hypothetical protein
MSEAASSERSRVKQAQPNEHRARAEQRVPGDQPAHGEQAAHGGRVSELQVSAHLMTLDTGLFCVFQPPGSPQPDPITALPGVRITPAPGIAGRPEAVSVSTFREDGWLNGTAALARVTDGPAQILVTIYQVKGMDAAPRLQVLRLSGEATAADGLPAGIAAANAPAAIPAATGPAPEIMAHVQRSGDIGGKRGDWIGVKGSRLWVEGFGLAPLDGVPAGDLEYQAVLGRNWLSPWIESGKYCGSRGMALPLLGIKVRLKGSAAKAFDCSYSATFVDGSEVGPVGAGDPCEAESLAALEAFQIVLHPRDGKAGSARPVTARKDEFPSGAVPHPIAAKPDAGKGKALPPKPTVKPRG